MARPNLQWSFVLNDHRIFASCRCFRSSSSIAAVSRASAIVGAYILCDSAVRSEAIVRLPNDLFDDRFINNAAASTAFLALLARLIEGAKEISTLSKDTLRRGGEEDGSGLFLFTVDDDDAGVFVNI